MVATTVVKFWLLPDRMSVGPLLLYYSAVMASAFYGGIVQGIFAVVLSLAAGALFFSPDPLLLFSLGPYGVRGLLFVIDSAIVIFICTAFRRARFRAEAEGQRIRAALEQSTAQLEQKFEASTKELRGTADRLAQNEKFLDSLVENIPNLLFAKRADDLRYIRINRAFEDFFERSKDELVGKTDFDLFPADQAEKIQRKDREVLSGHSVHVLNEERLTSQGKTHYFYTKKIPIIGRDGQSKFLLGIAEDITEKKAFEAQQIKLMQEQARRVEVEKAAQHLRFLADASATLNESLDITAMLRSFGGKIIEHWADWVEIVLMSEEDLKVQECIISHRDPLKDKLAQKAQQFRALDWDQAGGVGRVIRTGRAELHEVVDQALIDRVVKERERHAMISAIGLTSSMVVPLLSFGRVIGAMAISSTDPERCYGQLDLTVAIDLAKRASYAIENSRLFSKAQEANKAKSSFLATMSHEIRTPLGAILGFAELLSDENLNPHQKQMLATVQRNGQQLLRIVNEILDISKVESARIELENIEFSLPQLMDDVVSLMGAKAEEKGLSFHVNDLEDLPLHVICDPTRLRQVLLNVIGNAIKFTESGSVDVHVELHPRFDHPDHPQLEISVSDTGIGISRSNRDKLFQPFVQADNTMARRFEGTGLGLFLARRLARMMGGDVVLGSSHPLKGSQFIITVAIQIPEAQHSSEREHNLESSSSETPTLKLGSGKVLIVDDSADNRTLIQLFLSHLGVQADLAATGEEGVRMALTNEYKLILMDIQMPKMDGFEAVHALRAKDYHGPIVALTAHTMKGDRERCLEGGFDDFLGKPIDRIQLKNSLSKFVPNDL